jgi:hypothetical protein
LLLALGLVVCGPAPAALALPTGAGDAANPYLDRVARATYDSILAMIEPATGLPQDRFDRSLFDIAPQLALVHQVATVDHSTGAGLLATRCSETPCAHSGRYGLRVDYDFPAPGYGSYNVASLGADVSAATAVELWFQGAKGGERFELVLWSDCAGPFPGRPASAELNVQTGWQRAHIPLADFSAAPFGVNLARLCRVSFGFNDAMSPNGTVFIDDVAFVDAGGGPVHVPLDEDTSVTNIGLYMAAEIAAVNLGWQPAVAAEAKLTRTLSSVEAFTTFHGFPQTHNQVVSLQPTTGDTCISSVDEGYLAAGLMLVRQRFPALASRAGALLDAMDWSWLYDPGPHQLYGCRYPDGSTSAFHYDWLDADSRMAYLVAIGSGRVPAESWAHLNAAREPARCTLPGAPPDHYAPGWGGGGLFMQTMAELFVQEPGCGLRASACALARDEMCYARQIHAPAWGWSATGLPPNGDDYCGYGCVRDDVLVPHAAMLAAGCLPAQAVILDLQAFERLGLRAPVTDGLQSRDFGFVASYNWTLREAAWFHLVLDQSLGFLALADHLSGGTLRALFQRDVLFQSAAGQLDCY